MGVTIAMQGSSYAETRDLLRWRVALLLVVLISVLMVGLGLLNRYFDLGDTARLAWIVFGLNAISLPALLLLPRRLGTSLFFGALAAMIVFAVGFGGWYDRPLYYWGYLFPPVIVFLLPAWRALAAMLMFGLFSVGVAGAQLPLIDVVRIAVIYGLILCFVTTHALLEERASLMLREQGNRDGLTGCLNRRSFNEALVRLQGVCPKPATIGVLLADIDHFKAINDHHGHLEGDRVLVAVASLLDRALQAETTNRRSTIYRYGGEEFAVLVRDRNARELEQLAEVLRRAVAGGGGGLGAGELTISIGVAAWTQGAETPQTALQRADEALYQAKREGRNRVVISIS